MADLSLTKHWPGLDGMRAVAVLAVVGYHLALPHFDSGGFLGVDVFFVLSGFLITSLLIGEKMATGVVNMRDFAARRALRLLPALLAVILLAVAAVLTIRGVSFYRHDTLFDIPAVLFFVGNWLIPLSGHLNQLGLFTQTWSLSVEEQFYLIWPICLVATMGRFPRARIAFGLLLLVGLEWIVRLALVLSGASYARIYYSTFFHSDGLLLGASLALLASERLLPSKFATSRRLPWLALGIIIAMMLAGYGSLPYGWAIMTPITVAATALVIASVTSGSASPLSRSLSVKPLLWIGKRSYGIYLWHATILWIIAATPFYGSHVYLADVFVVALTFGAAAASYALIERPALRLKVRRFSRTESLPEALEEGSSGDVAPTH
ncbi:MAG: acyltransferase [Acidimicrobiales bacterium]